VQIRTRTFENAISLPEEIIVRRDGRPTVFVMNGGTASARVVELGFVDRGRVLITQGLNPQDQVIVTGHKSLQDGDRVQPR
jgi:multidrug efflux pump subunit AcrA (membrane-fusion protein)